MSRPTRTSRKAFVFEAGSKDHGKGRLATSLKGGFIGTGLGPRYSTRVGPCGWTPASPLDRRSGIDDIFQTYVSIGQAF